MDTDLFEKREMVLRVLDEAQPKQIITFKVRVRKILFIFVKAKRSDVLLNKNRLILQNKKYRLSQIVDARIERQNDPQDAIVLDQNTVREIIKAYGVENMFPEKDESGAYINYRRLNPPPGHPDWGHTVVNHFMLLQDHHFVEPNTPIKISQIPTR